MAGYFIRETMASAPSGALSGNAAYIAGSPSYLRLTVATNGLNGQLNYTNLNLQDFDAEMDWYANGGADANYFYWNAQSVPVSEDDVANGYKVAADEYDAQIQLLYGSTVLSSVAQANLGNATRRIFRVERRGQNIKVYMDGVLKIDYTDLVTRSAVYGNIGIGARTGGVNAEHRCYSFSVAGVDTPEPVLPPNVPSQYSGTQNLDSRYTLDIVDSTSQLLAEFSARAKNRSIKLVRNGTYEAEWEFDLNNFEQFCRTTNVNPKSLLGIGQNGVVIRRVGVPLFGGQISYYESDLSDQKIVKIKALGWLDLFKDRYTAPSVTYTAQDAGAIAWDLIDDSQTGTNKSFGITQGAIQTSVNRNRTYEYKNIKEAIVQLSQVKNGFDFEFTYDKKFYVYYPSMGKTRTEFELSYPGAIKSIRVSTDATKLLNYAIVRGQGFGEGQMIDVRQEASSQSAYKYREAILDYSDVPDITTLQELGDEDVASRKDPIEIIEITLDGNRIPYLGSYGLGDRVKVKIEDVVLYQHIDAYYRIDEINIKIDDNDNEEVTLKLTL